MSMSFLNTWLDTVKKQLDIEKEKTIFQTFLCKGPFDDTFRCRVK